MLWNKGPIVTLCVLVVLSGIGGVWVGQNEGTHTTSGPLARAHQPEKAPPPAPKDVRYKLEMRGKTPWEAVFQWYAKASGLPYIDGFKPAGWFTFTPSEPERRYTLQEITDFLNDSLLTQKLILVRRPTSFTVLVADEKYDPTLLPQVRVEDLASRGRTELVRVMLPLKAVQAKEVRADVQKLLGQFGNVEVLEKGNQLLLQDLAGNLQRIHQTIKEIEAREAEKKQQPSGK